jgi:hypothetical protein
VGDLTKPIGYGYGYGSGSGYGSGYGYGCGSVNSDLEKLKGKQ